MNIQPKSVVTLTYRLNIKDEQGNEILFQETDPKDPFIFLCGAGQLIPAFEKQLFNKVSGDTFDFWIPANEAYGERKLENIIPFPIHHFLDEQGKLNTEVFQVGNIIQLMDANGNEMLAKIHHVGLEEVTLDFNHDLAGKDLHFTGSIIFVRPATSYELEEAGFSQF